MDARQPMMRRTPNPPFDRLSSTLRDHDGAERFSAAATLTYAAVGEADVDSHRKEQALIDKRAAQRQQRRERAIAAGTAAPPSKPADPRLRGMIDTLRVEAATVREEVPDADHCREQLALAQATVQAATEAETRARREGNLAEIEHARVLTTEAYAGAAFLAFCRCRETFAANRVLPIPPGPTSVIKRVSRSSGVTVASSSTARPKKSFRSHPCGSPGTVIVRS
ncbi:hypothetical protein [Nocardia thraciensis]